MLPFYVMDILKVGNVSKVVINIDFISFEKKLNLLMIALPSAFKHL